MSQTNKNFSHIGTLYHSKYAYAITFIASYDKYSSSPQLPLDRSKNRCFGTPAARAFFTSSFCSGVYDQCNIRFVIVSSHLGFSLSGFLTGLAPALPLEALALSAASDFCDSSTYSSSFACSLSIFCFCSFHPAWRIFCLIPHHQAS